MSSDNHSSGWPAGLPSPLQTLVSSEDITFPLSIFHKLTNMAFSDSSTDFDSNFGIPGRLTDTTGSPAGHSEPPQERRKVVDAVDHLRATR